MANKSKIEKLTDEYIKKLKDEGMENVVIFTTDKEHKVVGTALEAENKHIELSMVTMLIKIIAENEGVYSPDLARQMAENLEEAEERYKEYEKEQEKEDKKKEKKTIRISID